MTSTLINEKFFRKDFVIFFASLIKGEISHEYPDNRLMIGEVAVRKRILYRGASVTGTWKYPGGASQTVEDVTSFTGYAFFF